ncbi:MAG: sigma-54-dependent Fis family transcriptional regulator, partial [Kiritimatiellae bacterium]|nr:sigma-54-dependent Fis family transcriptional regulator [Kiritimatiellia bacterium]
KKMSARYSKSVVRISTPAMNMLMSYGWPGNVRELENAIERAVLTTTDDCIHGYNLPPACRVAGFEEAPFDAREGRTLREQLQAFERAAIEQALRRNGGCRSAAGRELDVSPRMMNYRMKRLGIA